MSKAQTFKYIYEQTIKGEKFIDSLPVSVRSAFFDNELQESTQLIADVLIRKYFDEHWESVEWFLYEWKPGYTVGIGGRETMINNIDEYIEWMRENEDFE
jgi:hypothetical protein